MVDPKISHTLDFRRELRGFDPAVHVVIMHPGPRMEFVTRDEAARRILESAPDGDAEELGRNLEPLPGLVTVAEQSESGWIIRHMR
jgi:hypothetical protein